MLGLLLTSTASCVDLRKRVDAVVWVGDAANAGVYRSVKCTPAAELEGLCKVKCPKDESECKETYEEFLPASHPTFNRMRAFLDDDLNRLLEEAMKKCGGK